MEQGAQLRTMELRELHEYQQQLGKANIDISFEQVADANCKMNFIAMIYQEAYDVSQNQLLIYDIGTQSVIEKMNVNPDLRSQSFMYVDDLGYNCFKIARSSILNERKELPQKSTLQAQTLQSIKFKIFTIYIETLGLIQAQEILITESIVDQESQQRDDEELLEDKEASTVAISYELQLVGIQQMMMSNNCIKSTNWNFLKASYVIPFLDENQRFQGCQFIMVTNKNKKTMINLIDQQMNNLYTYESDLACVGQKRLELTRETCDEFLILISVKLRDSVLKKNILDKRETQAILSQEQDIILNMRRPDLEYVVLHSFEQLLKKDFFTS